MIGLGMINGWAAGASTTALGLNQYYKGKKMLKNNERPTYDIPEEYKQNLSQAQQEAMEGLPEEQKQQFINNLQRSSAYGLSQNSSRSGGLAGISAMNQNQNDAYAGLRSADAAARMQNQNQLYGARNAMADQKAQAFQFNKVNPYYEKQAQGLGMEGAGMQNIGNSFQIAEGSGGSTGKAPDEGFSGKQMEGNGNNSGQMSQQYWNNQNNQGINNNYNPNSQNGAGNFNYQGNQFGNVG